MGEKRDTSKSWDEPPRSLSILDDPQSCTIFDAPSGVLKLGFPVNLSPSLLRQLFEVNLARMAHINNSDCPCTFVVSKGTSAYNRICSELTKGVFPMAPVKPSTVPEVNDLPSCSLKAREFCAAVARTDTNIVVVEVKG